MINIKKFVSMSILTIVMCVSLIVGATFALFTSESSVNIAVTSGKVAVVAEVEKDSLVLTSMDIEQENSMWENGGSATFDDSSMLVLSNMTPGDGVSFSIKVTNESNVNVGYKINWSVSGDLAEVLEISVNGADFNKWTEWNVPTTEDDKIKTISVLVKLPEEVGDEYQEKLASISFIVEAIQGNAVNSMLSGVSITGITGYEDTIFSSVQEAYDTISPVIDNLAGLEINHTTKDEFDKVFCNNGKITWTIYGEQTVDIPYLFSFGRKASYYNNDVSITEINIVGGNDTAKLVMNTGVSLPFNWWTPEDPTVSVNIKDLTLEKGKAAFISFEPQYGYKFDLSFTNCDINGTIYYMWNNQCELTFDTCRFQNIEGNTYEYAAVIQGSKTEESIVKFINNTFEGYARGINLQRANTEFVILNNTFKNSTKQDKGVVQVTEGKKFTISGNTFENGVSGYAILLHSLLKNADVLISNNKVDSAKYLSMEMTADANVNITESQNTGTAINNN